METGLGAFQAGYNLINTREKKTKKNRSFTRSLPPLFTRLHLQ